MATVQPLFIIADHGSSLATLQAKLRLSGLASDSDAFDILEFAVLEVRTGFIRHLGIDRINEILTYTHSDTPANDDEAIRLIAEVTEVKWCKMILMRSLTNMSLDGSGGAWSDFHKEAAFRETGPFERTMEMKELWKEISENLDLLSKREIIPNETTGFQGFVLEPDPAPPKPGETIFNYVKKTND